MSVPEIGLMMYTGVRACQELTDEGSEVLGSGIQRPKIAAEALTYISWVNGMFCSEGE